MRALVRFSRLGKRVTAADLRRLEAALIAVARVMGAQADEQEWGARYRR